MANYISSQGTTLSVKLKGSTDAAVVVGGIKQISGLGSGSLTINDVSTLASTAKDKAAGLPDEGSVKLGGQYLDKDTGQTLLDGARSLAELVTVTVTLKSNTTFTFDAIVKTMAKGVQVDSVASLDCELEVSGPITKSTGA